MAIGIIAEYNPFHKGHKYHIENTLKIKNDDIVVIMSGNFVQRGEPSILEKHIRTEMALQNGVSMVIELPVEYATASADVFSKGAVQILDKTNIISHLSFGSEYGQTDIFNNIADILNNEPEEFKTLLKNFLSQGLSYPASRNKALEIYLNQDLSFLSQSNNILALEYVRSLKQINSKIKPLTVKRVVSKYNQSTLSGEISSATSIRQALLNNDEIVYNSMPENCKHFFNNLNIKTLDDYTDILKYILLTTSKSDLSTFADVTEGIENRILSTDFATIGELLSKIKTKRYTYTKLQKAIVHILLNIKKSDQNKNPQYIRILGFKKDKKYLLTELTKKATLPVLINVKENETLLQKEILSTDIYNLVHKNKKGLEYTTPVVIK